MSSGLNDAPVATRRLMCAALAVASKSVGVLERRRASFTGQIEVLGHVQKPWRKHVAGARL